MQINDIRTEIMFDQKYYDESGNLTNDKRSINVKAVKPDFTIVSPFIQLVIDNLWNERTALINFINEKLDDIENPNEEIESLADDIQNKMSKIENCIATINNELDDLERARDDADSIAREIENKACRF